MTVSVDADAPAFSENVGGLALRLRAVSLSLIVSVVVALANPVAEAVIVTVAAPSTVSLSIAAIVAVAVVWPARIVTVAGTVALFVLDDVSVTICAAAVEPVRVTVSVEADAPAFSEIVAGLTLAVKIGTAAVRSAFARAIAPVVGSVMRDEIKAAFT